MPAFGALTKPLIDKPGKRDRAEHAWMLERDRRHLANDGVGAIERGAVRQLRERDEILLVLRRHESRRHAREPGRVRPIRPT